MTRLNWLLVCLLSSICIILLLWGGTGSNERLLTELWDVGHVVAFFCWSLLLSQLTFCKELPFNKFLLVALLCTAIVGTSIELLQLMRHSVFSSGDLIKDLTGTCLALSIICYYRPETKPLLKVTMIGVSLILSMISLKTLTITVYDEIQMYREFPVLVDFQDPEQQQRIHALDMKIVKSTEHSSLNMLQLDFNTANYSGFALLHFVGNWSKYSRLSMQIYRQQSTPLIIHCRINDMQHDINGFAYNDRFNRQYLLTQGWNIVDIALEEVKSSPINRELDLANVTHLGCFVISQPSRQTIFLSTISLY